MNIRKKVTWVRPPQLGRYAALGPWAEAATAQGWSDAEIQHVLDEVVEATDEAAGLEALAWYCAPPRT